MKTTIAGLLILAAAGAFAQDMPDASRTSESVLDGIGRLGTDLGLGSEQTRLYAELRGTAARALADRQQPRDVDPFAQDENCKLYERTLAADRAAVAKAGSAFYATMGDGQRRMLSTRWRETFGQVMRGGGPRCGHEGMGRGGPWADEEGDTQGR